MKTKIALTLLILSFSLTRPLHAQGTETEKTISTAQKLRLDLRQDSEYRLGRFMFISGIVVTTAGAGLGAMMYGMGSSDCSYYEGPGEEDEADRCYRGNVRNQQRALGLIGLSVGLGVPLLLWGAVKKSNARQRLSVEVLDQESAGLVFKSSF